MKSVLNNYTIPICAFIFSIWGAALYTDTFANLWHFWQTPEYGHGLLLPVISVVWALFLLQKEELNFNYSYIGVLGIIGALTLNCLGMVISNNWLSNISFVFLIIGMVWAFLGFHAVKRSSPALILLFFAIPLPVTILPVLTADLQLLSSSMGVNMLQMVGIPVYQEGNIIDLGDHKLDVAIACSGLQYLFPLMSLSYMMAFLSFHSWWKRAILFLSAIPITIVMNAARIALSGVIYTHYGVEVIVGFMHYFEGYAVFAVCLIVLLGIKYCLNLCPPKHDRMDIFSESFSLSKLTTYTYHKPRIVFYIIMLCIFAVFSAGTAYIMKQHSAEIYLPRKSFYNFPLVIGNWTGTRSSLPAMELETLNLTDHFVGNYSYPTNDDFAPINLYIAYYDKQTQENSIHSPQICLPGGGWVITSHEIHDVGPLKVNKEIMQKDGQKLLVYYWFREAGYDAATNWEIKKLLLVNSLTHGRTDGSLIRLTAPVTDSNLNDVENQMDDFLKNLLPRLEEYLPEPS